MALLSKCSPVGGRDKIALLYVVHGAFIDKYVITMLATVEQVV